MHRLSIAPAIVLLVALLSLAAAPATAAENPNIVLIMADDLGYAELGSYGKKIIKTPALDHLAAGGMRFTQYYCGNAVCAPSRCVLMTGKHSGHAWVRTNQEVKPEGQFPLAAAEVTLAEALKARGYATGAMGKWGLGPPASEGDPNRQGFDLFFGYNCQRHAHNHYPAFLYRNDQKITYEGNDGKSPTGKTFSQDLFEAEALKFLEEHKAGPFFLYLPFIIPHLALQVPEDSLAEYKGKFEDPPYTGGKGYLPHPTPRAAYAAMITRMDRTVGRIVDRLKELGLAENTIVFFTSDNGPTYDRLGGSDSDFFHSAAEFRGLKGSLYEGGIRVPMIASWPGKIKPGTSELVCAAQDFMPTLCELTGATPPAGIDGVSLVPTLLGAGKQTAHEYLYWEFPSYGGQQAVRLGKWKATRQNLAKGKTEIELYDLATDIGEKKNVAAEHPDIVKRIELIMKESHTPSANFPLQSVDIAGKK